MYTSHGYMTHADYQEYLKDTDQGSTVVNLDDPPLWFSATECPCGRPLDDHESVTVQDASGEIYACSEGWTEPAPAYDGPPW
jgi:hypothetical protein